MTKITEASSMRELGVSSKDVGKLYKHSYMGIRHDLEFEPITTKGQASSKMKNGYLLVAINDGAGEVAMIYSNTKRYGAGSYYYITKPDGEQTVSSLKDVLVNLPGKGWKYYASTEPYRPNRAGEKRSEEEVRKSDDWEQIAVVTKRLERVHGPQLRKEAAQYADEIREHLIAFIDSDVDKTDERRYRMRDDEYNGPHMHFLRQAFKELRKVAQSDEPFHTVSSYINAGKNIQNVVQKHLKYPGSDETYWGHRDDKEASKYIRNAKLASAKIAKLYFKLLRDYRDKAIEAVGDAKVGNKKKATLGKVHKAWESYKKGGNIKPLS